MMIVCHTYAYIHLFMHICTAYIVHTQCWASTTQASQRQIQNVSFLSTNGHIYMYIPISTYIHRYTYCANAVLRKYDSSFTTASLDEAALDVTSYMKTHGIGAWEVWLTLLHECDSNSMLTMQYILLCIYNM